ncbi:helix-turn-helix domain-containing protein [Brachybacterium tyrofermentans]|uniref:helix-turn-helix domain-containing protein n=1 Tax=Brachybacterium tyrofermentans TaxID=47848 RepID=UPI003FD5E5FE
MDGNEILSRQFITLDEVQVVLSISRSQAYALVRTGDLRAIRVGGRGQWRVELTELDAYIERCYQVANAATADDIAAS